MKSLLTALFLAYVFVPIALAIDRFTSPKLLLQDTLWLAMFPAKLLAHVGAHLTIAQLLSLIPGKLGSYIRTAYYRHTLEYCDRDCYIGFLTVFNHRQASVERDVYIGDRCSLGMVAIHQETMLADNVQVLSGSEQHGMDTATGVPFQKQERKFRRITIHYNCWIGTSAVIMDDVGVSAIVAAGAVVTNPVKSHTLVGGVPAKEIKRFSFPSYPARLVSSI